MTTRALRTAGAAFALIALATTLTACGSTSAGGASSSGSAAASSAKASPTSTVPSEAVIGMTVEEATQWASEHGNTLRVVKQDGQPLPATKDFRAERINVDVENGVVTAATMG